ncbi:MAG TPA: sodium-dependent transporter [Candidatus Atribacteria bacterium]|jgi:NSS family neurotransmitter:Na+ symporter|nr:MAG: Transporter [Atribacteria bacterium 34_128]HAJ33735.1 sodium-dependent transporter [Candidatus Atribacteria bacterium]
MENKSRGNWQSQVGFIAAAAGSAVGLGNIWKFPYITGKYGGAAFVLVYLIIIIFIGVPLMNSELLVGRKSGKNALGAFKELAPKSSWWIVGAMGILAGFIILSYYSVIGGWATAYIFKSGAYMAAGADHANIFVGSITNPWAPLIWHAIFMLMCIGIVVAGIEKGIEKYTKILMPALLVIMLILIIRSVTLPGAGKGLAFYLKPDFSKLTAEGILAALGQAFFSLSLGMGCMITYGSYLKKDQDIPANSYWIAGADTAIAFLAGFAIFPAVFAFGLEPGAGPGLTFITLPAVFASMGAVGHVFGILFFFLLTIAALTSAISLLEVVCAYFIDEAKWDRKKATWIMGTIIFLLGIPSSLGQGVWSGVKIIGGRDILDSLDFIASNILLPLGGLLLCIFIGWYWGTDKAIEEANIGAKSIKLGATYSFLIKYVAPVAIFIVFLKSIGVF